MPYLRGAAPHPGQRGLHRFLHHRPELPGHDQPLVAARHAAGFDEQHIAAHRRPRQPHRDAGTARALGHFRIGTESRRAEILLHHLRRHLDLFARALRDAPRLLAADRADLALQVAHAGLARVAAHQEAHRVIA